MNRILRGLIFVVLFVFILNSTGTAFTAGPLPTDALPAGPSGGETEGPNEVFSPDGTIARVPNPVLQKAPVQPAQPAAMSTVVTVEQNGPSSNRMDFVFLGDGYTSSEMSLYSSHVTSKWDMIFTLEPYATYRKYFNAYQVNIVSSVSGVSNDPTEGITRNTPLGAYFWCNGMDRLLCVNTTAAYNYALEAPVVDDILVLANSTMYGGAGYTGGHMATASGGNGSSGWIMVHEMGHSIGALADEYEYSGANYTGGEPYNRNISIYNSGSMLASGTKWYRWMNETTPDGGTISTYEGASLGTTGIYRPSSGSLMRYLGRPYNLVGIEAMVIAFYQTVRPIDASTPTDQPLPASTTISVTPLQPVGHNLTITWYANGQPIPANQDLSTLNMANIPLSCSSTQAISVVVVDDTPMVRDPAARAQYLTDRRDWTVTGLPKASCPYHSYEPLISR